MKHDRCAGGGSGQGRVGDGHNQPSLVPVMDRAGGMVDINIAMLTGSASTLVDVTDDQVRVGDFARP